MAYTTAAYHNVTAYVVDFYRHRYRWKDPHRGIDRWVADVEFSIQTRDFREIEKWFDKGYRVASIEPIGSDDEF
jgi:hypothetical protein